MGGAHLAWALAAVHPRAHQRPGTSLSEEEEGIGAEGTWPVSRAGAPWGRLCAFSQLLGCGSQAQPGGLHCGWK